MVLGLPLGDSAFLAMSSPTGAMILMVGALLSSVDGMALLFDAAVFSIGVIVSAIDVRASSIAAVVSTVGAVESTVDMEAPGIGAVDLPIDGWPLSSGTVVFAILLNPLAMGGLDVSALYMGRANIYYSSLGVFC
jgi:hypothetical protein